MFDLHNAAANGLSEQRIRIISARLLWRGLIVRCGGGRTTDGATRKRFARMRKRGCVGGVRRKQRIGCIKGGGLYDRGYSCSAFSALEHCADYVGAELLGGNRVQVDCAQALKGRDSRQRRFTESRSELPGDVR